jgi:hypothetical protein
LKIGNILHLSIKKWILFSNKIHIGSTVALFEKLASKSFTELFAAETKVTHELKETWKMQKRATDLEYYEELCKDTDGNVLEQAD